MWRTTHALGDSAHEWEYISGSFGTNAIGSLLLDPSDPTGNTLYAATGEENASGDSEAGVGIYKTTEWRQHLDTRSRQRHLLSTFHRTDRVGQRRQPPGADRQRRARYRLRSRWQFLRAVQRAIRSITRGLYRQTGSRFTLIWAIPAPVRGSTRVQVDPTHPGIIYVNAFQQGIWRSTDNGGSFTQIFTPQDPTIAASATDRSEFDVTTLANGATRMYVGEGQGGGAGHHSNFWRSDNADSAATFVSMRRRSSRRLLHEPVLVRQ